MWASQAHFVPGIVVSSFIVLTRIPSYRTHPPFSNPLSDPSCFAHVCLSGTVSRTHRADPGTVSNSMFSQVRASGNTRTLGTEFSGCRTALMCACACACARICVLRYCLFLCSYVPLNTKNSTECVCISRSETRQQFGLLEHIPGTEPRNPSEKLFRPSHHPGRPLESPEGCRRSNTPPHRRTALHEPSEGHRDPRADDHRPIAVVVSLTPSKPLKRRSPLLRSLNRTAPMATMRRTS